MAITIRELLASDTVSQAADKINFNFDQLLLNGGGPQGPQGPQGPPGPIGGRGIRGSVWYEDTSTTSPGNNPNTVPPTLTPEDEDNYLQFNGIVWTYDASIPAWVPTNIDLTGPVGPPGASGKFAQYQALPYTAAGDTTIFPDEISLSPIGLTQGVRSVLIGGFPETVYGLTPPITPGTNIVPTAIASQLQMPDISMMVHQFDSNGTAIMFHGGDSSSGEWFSQTATSKLSRITLAPDDALRISSPKERTPANLATTGIYIEAANRGIDLNAGRELTIRTGTATSSDTYAGQDNFLVQVAQSAGNSVEPYASISTVVSGQEAELRIGETSTPTTTTVNPGNLVGLAGKISLIGSDAMNLRTGSTIDMIGAGLVRVRSTGDDAELSSTSADVNITAAVDANIQADQNIIVNAGNGNVNVSTSAGTGGDILIDTSNTGSQIKLETDGDTSPINLRTNGTTSPIRLETTGIGGITLDSNTTISLDATDSIAATALTTIATVSGGDTSIFSASDVVIDTDTFGGGDISLLADTGNINMTTTSGNVNITASDLTANGNVNITSGGTNSEITLKRSSSTTVVNILSGGAASGSYLNIHVGNTTLSSGIRLQMENATTGSIVAVGGTTDTFRIAMPSTVKVEAETGVTPASGTTLEPRFDVDASIDVSSHGGTYDTAVADEKIFGSGTFTRAASTQNGDITINWIRVGNIVTCTGIVTGNTGNPIQPAVSIVPIRGGSITDVYGVWNSGSGNYAGRVEIYTSPTEIEFLPNPAEVGFYFSFSYRIQ